MLTVEEYRKRAEECVELAQTVREPERAKLLKLAQDWLTLADEGVVMPPDSPNPPAPSQRR